MSYFCFFCQNSLQRNSIKSKYDPNNVGLPCKDCAQKYDLEEVSTIFNEDKEIYWVLIITQIHNQRFNIWLNIKKNFVNVFRYDSISKLILSIPNLANKISPSNIKNKMGIILTLS